MTVPNKRNLTLKDVALKLGTSTATISNAFNRPDQLSAKKRKFILEACEELGFSGPNKAAQILRKGKSNIIALVLAHVNVVIAEISVLLFDLVGIQVH